MNKLIRIAKKKKYAQLSIQNYPRFITVSLTHNFFSPCISSLIQWFLGASRLILPYYKYPPQQWQFFSMVYEFLVALALRHCAKLFQDLPYLNWFKLAVTYCLASHINNFTKQLFKSIISLTNMKFQMQTCKVFVIFYI